MSVEAATTHEVATERAPAADPVARATGASPMATAAALQRLERGRGGRRQAARAAANLQAACGNRAVGRILSRQETAASPSAMPADSYELDLQEDERLLTDAEHRFVEPFEAKRVELSDKAAGKLVQLIQDIVAGDAEMLRQAPYEGSRAKRPSGWPPPTGEEAEKSRVRLAVRKHLRLASLFGFGPVGYDYLNDARAAKALDVIREATDMILMQARRRLSRRVVLSAANSQQVAQRPLARDVIRFVPGFFDVAGPEAAAST